MKFFVVMEKSGFTPVRIAVNAVSMEHATKKAWVYAHNTPFGFPSCTTVYSAKALAKNGMNEEAFPLVKVNA